MIRIESQKIFFCECEEMNNPIIDIKSRMTRMAVRQNVDIV